MAYTYYLVSDERYPEDLRFCQGIASRASDRLGLPGVPDVWPMSAHPYPESPRPYKLAEERNSIVSTQDGIIALDIPGAPSRSALAQEVVHQCWKIRQALKGGPVYPSEVRALARELMA